MSQLLSYIQFLLLSITTLLLAIAYTLFIEETREFINEKKNEGILKNLISAYKSVFKNKRYLFLLLGWMFIFSAELSVSNYIAIQLSQHFKTITMFSFKIEGVRMFSLINIINTTIVVTCTFYIGRILNNLSAKTILIIGFTFYGIGYTFLTSADSFWWIISLVIVATIGELIYSPILNAEELQLIPPNSRGIYASVSSIKVTGGDLISKLGIVLGAFISPLGMSVIMGFFLILGSFLVIFSLYGVPI
ncbi:MFS transporter, partial [Listeria monocytogenes]|nr:MFS transporter [Listeria monocytogenes]